jgi:hypothetical protein
VKREYRKAIEQKKDVLPLLLDYTELPEDLAAYEYLDLKSVVIHERRHPPGVWGGVPPPRQFC